MLFSRSSFWNQRLPNGTAIDPNSKEYVASLVKQGEETSYGFSYQDFSASVFYASATAQTFAVQIDQPEYATNPYWKDLAKIMEAVPIPPQVRPPGPFPGDNHTVIYQPSADKMWEFWKFSRFEVDGAHSGGQAEGTPAEILEKPGYHCEAGAGYQNVSKSVGIFDGTSWPGIEGSRHFSATASGLPLAGGAILPAEAQRLYIPHAITVAPIRAKIAKTPGFRYPASKTDGESSASFAVQEGMCFRLPPGYEPPKSMDSVIRAVCIAIRDFGMYVHDGSANVTIKCANEATIPGAQGYTTDPWKGPEAKFGGAGAIWNKFPSGAGGLAEQIPWASLEVVAESYRASEIATGSILRGA